ncbi:MAG: hydrolase, haloacid dehalogenase-like family [Gemmatimonadetes bacterium]|nr:hydrolase, haloacid dehalogenase-like family [Gemmatimonadota bacterium]
MTGRLLRGVLLDVDGTLIDSNDAHADSWADTLTEAGYAIPASRVRPLIGMGGDKLIPRLTGLNAESPPAKELAARRAEIFHERYLPSLQPLPGARALLERMHAAKLVMVVATSAKREELEAMLEQVELLDLLPQKTSSDDAEESKPDPDIIVAALRRGKLDAGHAVMIGDTPYDVEAALRAGVGCIGFRSGGWGDRDLAGTLAVYDGPAALLQQWDSSPLAE